MGQVPRQTRLFRDIVGRYALWFDLFLRSGAFVMATVVFFGFAGEPGLARLLVGLAWASCAYLLFWVRSGEVVTISDDGVDICPLFGDSVRILTQDVRMLYAAEGHFAQPWGLVRARGRFGARNWWVTICSDRETLATEWRELRTRRGSIRP